MSAVCSIQVGVRQGVDMSERCEVWRNSVFVLFDTKEPISSSPTSLLGAATYTYCFIPSEPRGSLNACSATMQ